jgi:RNA polymerase sigma-70 factor (ECF subfamily)
VFLAALGPLRVSASVGEVRAYLSATARTVLAAHWRRHYGREITTLPELPDVAAPSAGTDQPGTDPPTGSPPGTATAELEAEGMLAELPERYAQVLRLRFLRGYTIRETANALDVTVANAKVLQHRALRRAAQLTGEAAR